MRRALPRLGLSVALACAGSACLDLAPGDWQFGCPAGQLCDAGAAQDSGPGDAGQGTDGGSGDAGFVPAAHRPWPPYVSDGGQVIAQPKLVAVVAQGDPRQYQLFNLADAVVNSPWLSEVGAEYGIAPATSGGDYVAALVSADGGSDLTWSDVVETVRSAVDAGAPAPDGQTAYVIFLPSGTTIGGKSYLSEWASFTLAGGTAQGDMILAMFQGTGLPGETPFDELSHETTHFLVGILADPWGPLGGEWFLPEGSPPWQGSPFSAVSYTVRAADMCLDTRVEEPSAGGNISFSRTWSNAAAARGGDPCVPALSTPYYNVSFTSDWYSAAAGQTITLPFQGWSTAPVSDWLLTATIRGSNGSFTALSNADLTVTSSAGMEQAGACPAAPGMNNGVSATLQLTVPAGAASGDWISLTVTSYFQDATTCDYPTPAQGDARHYGAVGVYVP